MWKAIEEARHKFDFIEYLKRKNKWMEKEEDLVDWGLTDEAFTKRPIHKHTNTVKMIHNWQHVGYQKYRCT